GAIAAVRTTRRVVALTFDDGPNPLYTPTVLAELQARADHATFFVLGRRAKDNPALIERERAAGDEVANHTFDHADVRTLSREALVRQITSTRAAIGAAG